MLVTETAEAALTLVSRPETRPESQPEVVVADMVMLGMEGVALVGALRQPWPALLAVLVSGYADQTLREALVSTDIACLSKPHETAELLATVARPLIHRPRAVRHRRFISSLIVLARLSE
jgi:DNA-binding NtrC family response regulator